MTFKLEHIGFASTTAETKRNADVGVGVSSELVFEYNCLAHSFVQHFKNPNLDLMAKDTIYRAYRNLRNETVVDKKQRDEFYKELAELNPRERERLLRRAFLVVVNRDFADQRAGVSAAQQLHSDRQALYNFMHFIGIKPEYYDYTLRVDEDHKNKAEKRAIDAAFTIPAFQEYAPTLKFLVKNNRSLSNLEGEIQNLGFEYEVQNRGIHNGLYQIEQSIYDNVGSLAAHNNAADASRRSGLGLSSADQTPVRNTPQPPAETLSGQNSNNGATGAAARTTSAAPASAFDGMLQSLQTFANNQKGFIGTLISVFMPFVALFKNFLEDAAQGFKANNLGRPLESNELVDDKARLFNQFVGKLPRGCKDIEALTEKWRAASNNRNAEAEKDLVIDALKQSLIDAGDLKAFDDLRFSENLAKVRNTNQKDFLREDVADKTQKWQILQNQLIQEGSYIEAEGILQHRCLEQLQKMDDEKVEYKRTNVNDEKVVDVFNEALNLLNDESNNLEGLAVAEKKKLCEDRIAILKACSTMEEKIAEIKKTLEISKETKENWANLIQQEQQNLLNMESAQVPPDAPDRAQRIKTIEERYNQRLPKQKKEDLERRTQGLKENHDRNKEQAISKCIKDIKDITSYRAPAAARPVVLSLEGQAAAAARVAVAQPSVVDLAAAARSHEPAALEAVPAYSFEAPAGGSGNCPPPVLRNA